MKSKNDYEQTIDTLKQELAEKDKEVRQTQNHTYIPSSTGKIWEQTKLFCCFKSICWLPGCRHGKNSRCHYRVRIMLFLR